MRQSEFWPRDKVKESVDLLRYMEPERGYWLAFSGGKDSVVIKQLAIEAGVKFKAHYHLTTLDPPEIVWYIKNIHPDVIIERPRQSFRSLCLKKEAMLPTRKMRFCCEILKEKSAPGQVVISGIKKSDSPKRSLREASEYNYFDPFGAFVNPIIGWTDADVWNFIREKKLTYCELYDKGWDRIGCLFCPMAGPSRRNAHAVRYRHHRARMVSICDDIVKARHERGLDCSWRSGEELFTWWINETPKDGGMPLFEDHVTIVQPKEINE